MEDTSHPGGEQVVTAASGWSVVRVDANGAQQIPVVAWRVGRGDPSPVPLFATSARPEALPVVDPLGTVWYGGSRYPSLAAFLGSGDAGVSVGGSAEAYLTSDLVEEDRAYATVRLANVEGGEFVLQAHEWRKLLGLARDHGWQPAGTTHATRTDWPGTYEGADNQQVEDADAAALAENLERTLDTLPPLRAGTDIAALSGGALYGLPASEYLGGVRGVRFVETFIRFARTGGFRIT